jgi:hypothetical protein
MTAGICQADEYWSKTVSAALIIVEARDPFTLGELQCSAGIANLSEMRVGAKALQYADAGIRHCEVKTSRRRSKAR